jgi:hypothetical protein
MLPLFMPLPELGLAVLGLGLLDPVPMPPLPVPMPPLMPPVLPPAPLPAAPPAAWASAAPPVPSTRQKARAVFLKVAFIMRLPCYGGDNAAGGVGCAYLRLRGMNSN